MKTNENEIRRLQELVRRLESRVVEICERIETLKTEDARRVIVANSEKNARRQVLKLARKHGIPFDDEFKTDTRCAVWAPPSLDREDRDPHFGDHYVYSWAEALQRVSNYVEALSK